MKTLKMRQNHKSINEYISAKNIIKPAYLPVFISSVIKFDKFFHPVVLYENDPICIFMNINENLKNERKILEKIRNVRIEVSMSHLYRVI